jgi:uncharacterized membrane protein YtjA (UPF0391 family)
MSIDTPDEHGMSVALCLLTCRLRYVCLDAGNADVTRKTRDVTRKTREEDGTMLNWAITFLIIGLIAGVLGFTGVAGAATQIAWVLFVVFLVLFLVSLIMGRSRVP